MSALKSDEAVKNLSLRIPVTTWAVLRKLAIDSGLDFQDYVRALLAGDPGVPKPMATAETR